MRREVIEQAAFDVGFNICGIARCRVLTEQKSNLDRWLEAEMDGGLVYLRRNIDKREDISLLVDGVQSVIVCAVSYNGQPTSQISSYALAVDYHVTIKAMLYELFEKLKADYPQLEGRAFTDSAPVFEKAWAVEAGLGALGRNSLLINPQWGSKILLGELVVNLPCDNYSEPLEWDCCKGCSACVNNCPNGAINDNKTINAGACISRMTIEKGGIYDDSLFAGWRFGCDVCQNCCPHNAKAAKATNSKMLPIITEQEALEALNGNITEKVRQTPISRKL